MSGMTTEVKNRTKEFSLRVLKAVQNLPENRAGRIIGDQLLRSGMSVGANYRSACRARSAAEFRAKLGIVEEECDETIYWLEAVIDGGLMAKRRLADLMAEAHEILSIVVASINTSKRNSRADRKSANPKSAIRNPK
jgi:four helix bundle protein